MPTQGNDHRPIESTTLTQALLERARGETGRARLWTLSVVSQRLRERLDTYDRHLLGLVNGLGTDRLVRDGRSVLAPAEAIEALAAIDAGLRRLEDAVRR
jgi:hypothetical protein